MTSEFSYDTIPYPSKFFLLTSANQIVTTFDTIATSLTMLHLSK